MLCDLYRKQGIFVIFKSYTEKFKQRLTTISLIDVSVRPLRNIEKYWLDYCRAPRITKRCVSHVLDESQVDRNLIELHFWSKVWKEKMCMYYCNVWVSIFGNVRLPCSLNGCEFASSSLLFPQSVTLNKMKILLWHQCPFVLSGNKRNKE